MLGPKVTRRLFRTPLLRKISSPASSRRPIGPRKPSMPPPGYAAKCVPLSPNWLRDPVNVDPDGFTMLLLVCRNPALPVRNARNGPEVPNWNLGPNRPVIGRTRAVMVVLEPLPDVPLVVTVV